MFKKFMSEHSFSEYKFDTQMFPTVSDRAYWDGLSNRGYVEAAESSLNFDWPIVKATDYMEFKKSGNRSIMERPHNLRRDKLTLFALAELVENKGRFLSQIVNGLFAICEESYWGLSAHWADEIPKNIPTPAEPYIDLCAGETAERLVMIATLLREPLLDFCPEILDRVEYELEVRIKTPYLEHRDYWWMGYGKRIPNNWNPWIISNVLAVFLLTEKNERRLYRALGKMFDELQYYYDGLGDDGGCDEGPGYWGRAGASLFECVYEIKQASGGTLDLFGDEKLGKIAAYLKTVHVSKDYFASVSDAHYSALSGLMIFNFAFARETAQPELMNFCTAVYADRTSKSDPRYRKLGTIRHVFYYDEFIKDIESYEISLPIHRGVEILPDAELAGIRSGELLIFAKGGHNDESHNHNDIGSFALYDAQRAVLVDVGIGTYTRFTFSEYRYDMIPWVKAENHNIPAFDGITQQYGRKYYADSFSATDDEIKISFASAYPKEAGLSSLERRLSFTESGMSCVDSFARENGNVGRVREVFMSVMPVEVDGNSAVIDGKYRITASAGSVSCEFIKFEDSSLEGTWKTEGVTRICFDAEGVDELEIRVDII